MKLQRITSAENSGILITWSRVAVANALALIGAACKIGIALLVMRGLRWLCVALGLMPHP